jgi:uncharacterized protein (TIGR02147 family)
MSVFKYSDYKKYVLDRIEAMPSGGRGELRKLAVELRMHTTRITHVFRGHDDLTLEQGLNLCRYLGLNDSERDFLLLLLQHSKAGSSELKNYFAKKLEAARSKSNELSKRIPGTARMSESDRATFYSNWFYSGIRLLTSTPGPHTVDRIAERLQLPRKLVGEVLEFLLAKGLCVADREGVQMGPKSTHLSADSPLISRLHSNWRLKGIEVLGRKSGVLAPEELFYTGPISIRQEHAAKIRARIVEVLQEIADLSDADRPDRLYCLNVDWFAF